MMVESFMNSSLLMAGLLDGAGWIEELADLKLVLVLAMEWQIIWDLALEGLDFCLILNVGDAAVNGK